MSLRCCGWALAVSLVSLFIAPVASEATTWYVDAANCPGPGDGTPADPFCQIQAAINASATDDTILVADGIYTGTGNKDLDFAGKLIALRSTSGNAAACIIDCEGSGRGFYFHTGEAAAAIVEGLTIRNGYVTGSSPGEGFGGGVFCSGASPTLTNCMIIQNMAYSYFSSGGGNGGGVYCTSAASPTLINCTISRNTAYNADYGTISCEGGGVFCGTSCNLVLTKCVISANTAFAYSSMLASKAHGGGVSGGSSSSLTLSECALTENTVFAAAYDSDGAALAWGGGVYSKNTCACTLTNCTISGNTASASSMTGPIARGGGVCCYGPTLLTNCTVFANSAPESGGGVYWADSSTTGGITNCIFWGDSPQEISVASVAPAVTFCDVKGGWSGIGNIDVDPGFAFSGDGHLMPGSPCIDAGTNSPAGGLPTQDLDGNPRPLDGDADGQATTDLGAYEFNPTAPATGVSRARIEFFVAPARRASDAETLSIRNAGPGTLSWALSWDGSWLQADLIQGESTGEVDLVEFAANAGSLSPGSYSTTVAVSDPQASNDPVLVEVVLHVSRTLEVPGDYGTIQAAIDAALVPGDQIVLADGVYQGPGNKDLEFHGKTITVRSASGDPTTCIIDCENYGRGFYFHFRETPVAAVVGLTIRNGLPLETGPGGRNGGGVYFADSSPTLINCTITENQAETGGGVLCRGTSCRPTLAGCTISENTAYTYLYNGVNGGGMSCTHSARATLIDCTIHGNMATCGTSGFSRGGGLYCSNANASLLRCTITGNTASASGSSATSSGGGICCSSFSTSLTNCTISGNTASSSDSYSYGGGLYFASYSPTMVNCMIGGNRVSSVYAYGGGLYCSSSSPALTNCTISGNTVSSTSSYAFGGGMFCFYSSPTLANCILWGDLPQEIIRAPGTPVVTYCNIQGGYTGTGNINLDPLFIDPDGPDDDPNTWQDNDYRLSAGSPCIDAGNNAAVPADTLDLDGDGDTTEPIPFDLDGLPRFVDDPAAADCPYAPGTCGAPPIVDMGAYEFQPLPLLPGDLNCDGVVDVNDIAPFALALVDPAAYQAEYPECDPARTDLNASGAADGLDIQPFVDVLLTP